MDWRLIIDVISNLIKDDNTREQIYKRLLDASDYTEKNTIEEECLGYDDAFDSIWEENFSDEEDESEEEDDDYDYDEYE